MTFITDMQHFLDVNGEVAALPLEAQELVNFLSAVIAAASINYGDPVALADTRCRSTVNGKPCTGGIEVWVYVEDNRIGWECLECEYEGVISHWEGTPWDKRTYTCH